LWIEVYGGWVLSVGCEKYNIITHRTKKKNNNKKSSLIWFINIDSVCDVVVGGVERVCVRCYQVNLLGTQIYVIIVVCEIYLNVRKK